MAEPTPPPYSANQNDILGPHAWLAPALLNAISATGDRALMETLLYGGTEGDHELHPGLGRLILEDAEPDGGKECVAGMRASVELMETLKRVGKEHQKIWCLRALWLLGYVLQVGMWSVASQEAAETSIQIGTRILDCLLENVDLLPSAMTIDSLVEQIIDLSDLAWHYPQVTPQLSLLLRIWTAACHSPTQAEAVDGLRLATVLGAEWSVFLVRRWEEWLKGAGKQEWEVDADLMKLLKSRSAGIDATQLRDPVWVLQHIVFNCFSAFPISDQPGLLFIIDGDGFGTCSFCEDGEDEAFEYVVMRGALVRLAVHEGGDGPLVRIDWIQEGETNSWDFRLSVDAKMVIATCEEWGWDVCLRALLDVELGVEQSEEEMEELMIG